MAQSPLGSLGSINGYGLRYHYMTNSALISCLLRTPETARRIRRLRKWRECETLYWNMDRCGINVASNAMQFALANGLKWRKRRGVVQDHHRKVALRHKANGYLPEKIARMMVLSKSYVYHLLKQSSSERPVAGKVQRSVARNVRMP